MSLAVPPSRRKFSNQIFIWGPAQEVSEKLTSVDDSTPHIILLFTWADAQPRHYLKYIEGYQKLYPKAKIIHTTATTFKTFFGGQKSAQLVVRDMVHQELIPLFTNHHHGAGTTETTQPRILAHAFSNSGGLGLEATIAIWHEVFGANTPLPLKALVLDSTPGGQTYHTEFPRWTAGIALGIKAPLPGPIIWAIAATIVTVAMVIPQVLGIEIMGTRAPRAFNTPQNISRETTRLYVYSTTDQLILYRDVEAHAEDAKKKGYTDVLLERFDGSSHVSHLRLDPEKYWNAVWKMWNTERKK